MRITPKVGCWVSGRKRTKGVCTVRWVYDGEWGNWKMEWGKKNREKTGTGKQEQEKGNIRRKTAIFQYFLSYLYVSSSALLQGNVFAVFTQNNSMRNFNLLVSSSHWCSCHFWIVFREVIKCTCLLSKVTLTLFCIVKNYFIVGYFVYFSLLQRKKVKSMICGPFPCQNQPNNN